MPSTRDLRYKRPFPFFSAHFETIYPALCRKVTHLPPAVRERIHLPDRDFLDLDWRWQDARKLVIIQHGLEGSSDRPYVLGMAKCFLNSGYDVLAWNFRSCSGEMNRAATLYHSGATDDLEAVIQHALKTKPYTDITLVGFSLGGNLTLKYLGEKPRPSEIKRAVAISTPLDLEAGSYNLSTPRGIIYEKRFLKNLKAKIRKKAERMPEHFDTDPLDLIKTLRDFDDQYTSRLHGYDNASDYYRQCSSKNFLAGIQVPTLILNAENDPILTPESLDPELTRNLPLVTLEITRYGGHVGYILKNKEGLYWSEQRALEFCGQF